MNAEICCGVYFSPRISTTASPLSPPTTLYGKRPRYDWISPSFLPIRRFTENTVFSGLVMAWRLATRPTSRSPFFAKPTMEGVVRMPSGFGMTTGWPPSMTATHEFVVPRSMPMTFPMCSSSKRGIRRADFQLSSPLVARAADFRGAETAPRASLARHRDARWAQHFSVQEVAALHFVDHVMAGDVCRFDHQNRLVPLRIEL